MIDIDGSTELSVVSVRYSDIQEIKMKKHKLLAIVLTASLAIILGNRASAQVATNVDWYILPTTLPDTIHVEFGTARDNWLVPLSMGVSPTTGSRIGNVTAIEVRDVFEVPDMCVCTNAGLKLWRGVFNPSSPYATMTGSRIYGTAYGIPRGGQMNMSGVSQRTLCDKVPLLNNQSSFSLLSYSVSRIGILKGADGKLFTTDDTYLKNGEPGTNMVDAVLIIGSRLGAVANSQTDIDAINNLVTTNGANVTFEYYFNGTFKGAKSVALYPTGGVPSSMNRFAHFFTPEGILFSLVGPPNSGPLGIQSTRRLDGAWVYTTMTGSEGSSVLFKFTGNPTNDMGFVRIK